MLVGTSPMALVATSRSRSAISATCVAQAKNSRSVARSIGTGSLGHLAMAQVGNRAGWTYPRALQGRRPLMTDAIGNQVPLAIGTVFLVTRT
jgi:tripartite-type tricarboxylate transporter receptor subunit TctC